MIRFDFTTSDSIESLPAKLKEHFPVFLERRIVDTEELIVKLEEGDFDCLKAYCHKNGGVAASYHLNRFSEMIESLRGHTNCAKRDEVAILNLVKEIRSYLITLR